MTKITLILFIIFCNSSAHSQMSNTDSEIRKQVIEQEEVQDTLKKQKEVANAEIIEAEKLAASAEIQARKAETETEKALAEYLLSLQNYRADISNIKLNKIKSIESKIQSMKDKTDVLKEIELKVNTSPRALTQNDLQLVTDIWREIVDDAIANILNDESLFLDSPPVALNKLVLNGEKFVDIKLKIETSIKQSETEKTEIEQIVARINRSKRDVGARLLLSSGRIRAGVMHQLIKDDKFSVWNFDRPILKDYVREVQVVPYRFLATFAEKYFDFKIMSQEGFRGWMKIVRQIFLLWLVFLLPLLLLKLFRKFSIYLENIRRLIFTNTQLEFKKRTHLALWIGRLNPYLPWIFAYLTLQLSHSLLTGTLLEPILIFLPYLKIYVLYRGFLILFSAILARTLLSKNLGRIREKQSNVQTTAMKLSILFFAEWAFLHATEDAVRQALVYNLIFDTVFYINIAIVAIEAKRWKNELIELSGQWITPSVLKRISSIQSPLINLIVFPILFFGNVAFLVLDWSFQWISQFEFGKKISSEIFKRRLEEATSERENTKGPLDEGYRSLFLQPKSYDPENHVLISRSPVKKCIDIISNWKNGSTHEDLILLYGNFGIGKSEVLGAIETRFQNELSTRKISFSQKVTKREQLFDQITFLFKSPIRSASELEEYDKKCEKTLVLLDDIHNVYLNNEDGLSAYRALIEISSLQLKNIFWCFTCNERALAHLNGLFGPNHFIGSKIELLSWIDSEIQELILKRHRLSNYRLKFDQVISAVHRGDILESSSGLEVQFFRLLWGQSRGNPSTAQELWLSAASRDTNQTIRISVPEFTNPKTLADLSDDILMVYAAIVKHENLGFKEIQQICNLPISSIRQAIKFGEDGLLLDRTKENGWRIHPKAQYVVHSQLIGRNFIYG